MFRRLERMLQIHVSPNLRISVDDQLFIPFTLCNNLESMHSICKHTGFYWPLILHCVLQNLPPVRNQAKRKKKKKRDSDREKPEVGTRISSYDYRSWDKFDVVSINLKLSAVGFANIVLLAIECVCKSSFCFGFMNWNQVTLCQMTIIGSLNPLTPKSD